MSFDEYDLHTAAFDQPAPGHVGAPTNAYALCFSPRCGSTLLAEALLFAGMGTPVEYLGIDKAQGFMRRWGGASLDDYVTCLHRWRTTPNGVFGVKVHWEELVQFRNWVVDPTTEADPGMTVERMLMDHLFPNLTYIRIDRRDVNRQAVSYWTGKATQEWVDLGDGARRPLPTYDFHGIEACRRELLHEAASWDHYFAANGIVPFDIAYEAFVLDYEAKVRDVVDFLGCDGSSVDVPAPRLRKQSGSHTDSYVARYLDERAALVG